MNKVDFPAIKPRNWPPEDLGLWNEARQPVEIFEEGGIAADWSAAYIDNVERTYGQFLGFLVRTGQLDPSGSPKDRIGKPIVKDFMDAFAPGRAEATLARALEGIAALVRACHPPDEARWLADIARRLSRKAKPLRPKEPRTASIDELIWLGERLVAEGRQLLESGKRHGAALFRDGLIILTLVAHPVRRSNLAGLQLGNTLFVEGSRIHVRFAAENTKNGVELSREYPAWLVAPFLEYFETVRPMLRGLSRDPTKDGSGSDAAEPDWRHRL